MKNACRFAIRLISISQSNIPAPFANCTAAWTLFSARQAFALDRSFKLWTALKIRVGADVRHGEQGRLERPSFFCASKQLITEDEPVFLLERNAMGVRLFLQFLDDLFLDLSENQLRHVSLRSIFARCSHDLARREGRNGLRQPPGE